MGHDEVALERVRHVLGARDDVVEKRMVGGRSFVVGGHLCCGVTGSGLMVRVVREQRSWALAQPHVRPLILGDRQPNGFVVVDPPGYVADADLAAWIGRALEAVASL